MSHFTAQPPLPRDPHRQGGYRNATVNDSQLKAAYSSEGAAAPNDLNIGSEGYQPAAGYAVVENISGKLAVQVPYYWGDTITDKDGTLEGSDVDVGDGIGPAITATTDLDTWAEANRLGVPGVWIMASGNLASYYTEYELLDSRLADLSSCTHDTRQNFDRSPYSGKMQWSSCGKGGDQGRLSLAATHENRECVVIMQVVTYSEADREAAKHLLNTFDTDCQNISSTITDGDRARNWLE